jgi:hypothetical protein
MSKYLPCCESLRHPTFESDDVEWGRVLVDVNLGGRRADVAPGQQGAIVTAADD